MPRTKLAKRGPSQARLAFGRNVRAYRHQQKLTLEDVADRADLSWSYLASVERGERNISVDNMQAIADALGLDLLKLLQHLP